jgi:hypothetical protein
MKKSNMLIAVFAVLAAVSVAKAENAEVNFDGGSKGLKPQSMHSIFAAAHSIVPAGTLKTDSETNKRLLGGSGDPCCDDPTILCYAPCEPTELRGAGYRMVRRAHEEKAIEKLKKINADKINDRQLAVLLDAPGTELWYVEGGIHILNRELKGRFSVNSQAIVNEMIPPAGSDRAAGLDDWAVGWAIDYAIDHTVGLIQEYGSWPPVPDDGMADYNPVIGQDFSPGWGRSKVH